MTVWLFIIWWCVWGSIKRWTDGILQVLDVVWLFF